MKRGAATGWSDCHLLPEDPSLPRMTGMWFFYWSLLRGKVGARSAAEHDPSKEGLCG